MKHTYTHVFASGDKITLTVDFSQVPPKMEASLVPPGCEDEYHLWKWTSVVPDVMNRLTPDQARKLAEIGQNKLRGL